MVKKAENVNPLPDTEPLEEPKSPLEGFMFHQRKALEETGKALEALIPEGFREHGGEAGREFVKGFKTLIDAAIEELEKATSRAQEIIGEEDDTPSTTGTTKVKVQVD